NESAPWLGDEQGDDVAGHDQAREAPAQAQVEERHDPQAYPDGRDDRRGQAALGEDRQPEAFHGHPFPLPSRRVTVSSSCGSFTGLTATSVAPRVRACPGALFLS